LRAVDVKDRVPSYREISGECRQSALWCRKFIDRECPLTSFRTAAIANSGRRFWALPCRSCTQVLRGTTQSERNAVGRRCPSVGSPWGRHRQRNARVASCSRSFEFAQKHCARAEMRLSATILFGIRCATLSIDFAIEPLSKKLLTTSGQL